MNTKYALLFALAASCAAKGERADGGGTCPAGETCSTVTPDGLYFTGARFGDGFLDSAGPKPTAVGGKQTITVRTGSSASSSPFHRDFTAALSTDSLSIESSSPPSVTVKGASPGSAYLRILDSAGALYDRINLSAAAIDHATLTPDVGLAALLDPSLSTDEPWALWTGSENRLIARLYPKTGGRLVDELLTLKFQGATATRSSWDAAQVVAAADASCDVTGGDGVARTFSISVADQVDSLDLAAMSKDPQGATLANKASALYCFRATRNGQRIFGAPWQLMSSGGITATLEGTCVAVKGTAEGAASFTISVPGKSKSFDLTIAPAKALPPSPTFALPEPQAAPGDRASY